MGHQHNSTLECGGEQPGMNGNSQWNVTLDALKVSAAKYLLDENMTILWMNDCFCSCVGYDKEEYQSNFSDLRQQYNEYQEEFASIKKKISDAKEQGEMAVQFTCRMPVKGGGYIWVHINGTIAEEETVDCPVFYAVMSDVSDIYGQQDEGMQYFQWIMDEYVGNIYISDMDTYELLYLNKASCHTLHMTQDEILGRKCYEVIQGQTSPCPFCNNHCLRRDEFYEWEFYNPTLEKNFMIKNRIIDWKGHRARIEMSHDMLSTEYKLAKKDRERDAVMKTIPGGLVRIDARDRRTALWYAADFLKLIGYTEEEFKNELHSKCDYLKPEDLKRVHKVMDTLTETGQNAVMEVRAVTRAGEQRTLTVTLCYVDGEDSWDGIPSYYSIGLDVTEERMEQQRQRKALEEAYQSARIANSAKTDFLSSMSHDIRTPMNAIIGMATIARANLDAPEKVKDCLNKINVSSHHLLSLINEVLDMSKIESGKIDLMPERVDLPELIQSVSDVCRALLNEKRQELQIHVGKVRHEKVIADAERLQQVFMNILSNAIKYTPEGGKICMMIHEMPALASDKGRYEFIFTDNGIGMSSDYIPHLFEPFSRAEDSRISKIQGTGLGMAITENIIHMMNGTIEVESRLGAGSRFTVSVPLTVLEDEEEHRKDLAGLPVLVVDDDQTVCENATLLLNELGMCGQWVLSGAEAVRCVVKAHENNNSFFAVILDWKMPEMDGLETVKILRNELGEEVPIIVISAYDYSEIEEEFVHAGADAFITKPLFKSKMLHVLELFCESGRMETVDALGEEMDSELCGRRVLLAEDNELNREIVIELLSPKGVLIDSAENGEQAVEKFRASESGYYDAVLMDIQMPVMNGYEATGEIRSSKREDAKTIPVIALTANAFVADISKARNVGMNDHIAKPVDIDHLVDVLKKWTGKRRKA